MNVELLKTKLSLYSPKDKITIITVEGDVSSLQIRDEETDDPLGEIYIPRD